MTYYNLKWCHRVVREFVGNRPRGWHFVSKISGLSERDLVGMLKYNSPEFSRWKELIKSAENRYELVTRSGVTHKTHSTYVEWVTKQVARAIDVPADSLLTGQRLLSDDLPVDFDRPAMGHEPSLELGGNYEAHEDFESGGFGKRAEGPKSAG